MKKLLLFITVLFSFLIMQNSALAYDDYYCNKDTVEQMAKMLKTEVGTAKIAVNSEQEFFARLNVASIILNNALKKRGDSLYEKMYNFTDSNYGGYSSYRDIPFEQYVPESARGELLYISGLILTGKYNVPKNIVLQAACSCFYGKDAIECKGIDNGLRKCNNNTRYGVLWSNVKTINGFYDHYFGYSIGDSGLSSVDAFNRNIEDTSAENYNLIALDLELDDYSDYGNSSTVCDIVSGIEPPDVDGNGPSSNYSTAYVVVPPCENPYIVRVIYFALIIINIVRIAIPIGLIVMCMIDFSKGVAAGKEEDQKKILSTMIKRVIYAILVFAVPWIVKIVMLNLGSLTTDVNYTECIENATPQRIDVLQYNYDRLLEAAEQMNGGNSSNSSSNKGSYDKVIFVGDSRTFNICSCVHDEGGCRLEAQSFCSFATNSYKPLAVGDYYYIAQGGESYRWFNSKAVPAVNKLLNSSDEEFLIVSLLGVNGFDSNYYDDKSDSSYKVLANGDWKNRKIMLVSVTPVYDKDAAEHYGTFLCNANVEAFNSKLKAIANSYPNVTYCDIYSSMKGNMSNYPLNPDGLHYTPQGNKEIYKLIENKCLAEYNNNSSNSGNDSNTSSNNSSGKKIMIAAGHSYAPYCEAVENECRESATASPSEPVETRKIAQALRTKLIQMGYSANEVDIVNELLGESFGDPSTSKSLYAEYLLNTSAYQKIDFSKYKYAIEFHFNAFDKEANGPTILCGDYCDGISKQINTDINNDVQAVLKTTKRNLSNQNTKMIHLFNKKKIPFTYLEVEFYDNPTALANYHSHINDVVEAIAKDIKKYYPPKS